MNKQDILDEFDAWVDGCFSDRALAPGEWWSADVISGMDTDVFRSKLFALLGDKE